MGGPRQPNLSSGPLASSLSIGEGDMCLELKALTAYYGIIRSLFQHMWDQKGMDDLPETDENFEIVASTVKCICDQTCGKCGGLNRMIIYQPRGGRVIRKIRIEHRRDTPAYRQREKEQKELSQQGRDKRQVEALPLSRTNDQEMEIRGQNNSGLAAVGGSKAPARAELPPMTALCPSHWLCCVFLFLLRHCLYAPLSRACDR